MVTRSFHQEPNPTGGLTPPECVYRSFDWPVLVYGVGVCAFSTPAKKIRQRQELVVIHSCSRAKRAHLHVIARPTLEA